MEIHPNKIKVKEYFNKKNKEKLTNWEKGFISNLYKQKTIWSKRQTEVFEEIVQRYQLDKKPVLVKIKVVADSPDNYTNTIKCGKSLKPEGKIIYNNLK
jgi:hypothetical protein